ncbi:MAG: hypothetical protein JO076_01020 [Verrucomicrobia bacterium]|nr:hypothetical protein [Verrucomicrobiota bacterium]
MEPYRTFDEILTARLKAVKESLRPATAEELHKLLGEIFAADPLHPWMESANHFVKEHGDEAAYRAETSDGVGLVFYPRTGRGMWYMLKDKKVSGVGIISEKNIKRLTQLVAGS